MLDAVQLNKALEAVSRGELDRIDAERGEKVGENRWQPSVNTIAVFDQNLAVVKVQTSKIPVAIARKYDEPEQLILQSLGNDWDGMKSPKPKVPYQLVEIKEKARETRGGQGKANLYVWKELPVPTA